MEEFNFIQGVRSKGERYANFEEVVALVDTLKENDLKKLFVHVQELLSFDLVSKLDLHVAEKIFSYLDAESLCAAASCCQYWRKVANTNSIWMRLCISRKIDYLTSLPPPKKSSASSSHSNPTLAASACIPPGSASSPGLPSATTDPGFSSVFTPCPWKLVFMRTQQLLHNWRKGHYYLSPPLKGHSKPVTSIDCNGSHVVSGSSDSTARVWCLKQQECTHVLEGHTDSVNDVKCKEGIVITGCADGLVRAYNLHTGRYMWAMYGHRGSVDHVAYNGDVAISGGSDCLVKVWDVKTGKEVHSLSGHTDEIECLWLGEEGVAVSGSWDHSMRIWDIRKGICKCVLLGHMEVVYCCTARNGRVVSGGGDGHVKLWDMQAGQLITSFLGHEQEVLCLQCSDDFIVSASADSTIRLWDYTGSCLHVMEEHIGIVRCLCLKGNILISAGDRKRINIWKVKDGELLHTVYKQQALVHRMCVTDTQILTASPDSPGAISIINYW